MGKMFIESQTLRPVDSQQQNSKVRRHSDGAGFPLTSSSLLANLLVCT